MYTELTIQEFLEKTAGKEPVPGGGSISALSAALAAALTGMVANLTIGRKKYEASRTLMEEAAAAAAPYCQTFVTRIDEDAAAYNLVFEAFAMPRNTETEQAQRSLRIQEATREAAEVPLSVARDACAMLDIIRIVAEKGNSNAITDAAVAAMAARTAALGAALNVRINLSSLKDQEYVAIVSDEIAMIEKETLRKEQEILSYVNGCLNA